MYFYGSLLVMVVSFSALTYLYFRARNVEDKIFYQTSVVAAFYTLILGISRIGLLVYPAVDKIALAGVGTALVVYGGLLALVATFVMGVAGGVRSYQDKQTPLMVTSVLALLVFPFLLPLFLFPFIFFYLFIKKVVRRVNDRDNRKKEKNRKLKMSKIKQKQVASSKKKRNN